jgi:hypothetical protein
MAICVITSIDLRPLKYVVVNMNINPHYPTIHRMTPLDYTSPHTIHYTVDGSMPQPFAAVGAAHSTRLYTDPFTLDTSKCVVKAIAVSR